jgi:hypothetical protein
VSGKGNASVDVDAFAGANWPPGKMGATPRKTRKQFLTVSFLFAKITSRLLGLEQLITFGASVLFRFGTTR